MQGNGQAGQQHAVLRCTMYAATHLAELDSSLAEVAAARGSMGVGARGVLLVR